MAKKKQKNKKKSTENSFASSNGEFIHIDPNRVRFQHSKIRPIFSGCGRSVLSTLEAIRNGEAAPDDIPPIQVIVGPDENDGNGPWYFSLNNRRLWVFKRCREEGLLQNNLIRVRVRQPKSTGEFERYTIANCAVEAKFMREKESKSEKKVNCDPHAVKPVDDLLKNMRIEEEPPATDTFIEEENVINDNNNDYDDVVNNTIGKTTADEVDGEDDHSYRSVSGEDINNQQQNKNRYCFEFDESSDDCSDDDTS